MLLQTHLPEDKVVTNDGITVNASRRPTKAGTTSPVHAATEWGRTATAALGWRAPSAADSGNVVVPAFKPHFSIRDPSLVNLCGTGQYSARLTRVSSRNHFETHWYLPQLASGHIHDKIVSLRAAPRHSYSASGSN